MKLRTPRNSAFTMAEAMVAMAGTVIIVAALLLGAVGVQKSLRASEFYAANQSDQRRLIDYLARDMRRAIALGKTTAAGGGGAVKLGAESLVIEGSTALALTLPGYYQNQDPDSTGFDQPLPVTTAGARVDYGTGGAPAPGVAVTIRKQFVAAEGSVCFVRFEGDAQTVIVRRAEHLHLRLALAPDGRSAVVEVWFQSPLSAPGNAPAVATFDHLMLRNLRID